MEHNRLHRFQRSLPPQPLILTERDKQIIKLLHRHRFLRSNQISALMAGSSQQILRRLQLLYHHGYIERPRAQLDYYHKGGSRYIVYGLGNKGGTYIKHELGLPLCRGRWGEKNRAVGRIFLEHAVLVSEVMVAIQIACRKESIRFIAADQLALPGKVKGQKQPFAWRVQLNNRIKSGIVPDQTFALDFTNAQQVTQRAYFFLEADRGTMPVVRKKLAQTSFHRKLLAYETTWAQSIHQTKFGFHRFRVLTVTPSVGRVKSLLAACSKLKSGHGLFLFADTSILEKPEDILSATWRSGRTGETGRLLD